MKKQKLVKVEWSNPVNDWPWFLLLGFRGEFIHLRGADYPDGSGKHNGETFWVHKSEVKSIVDAVT